MRANVYKTMYVYMFASCLSCISVFLYIFLQIYSLQHAYLNVMGKQIESHKCNLPALHLNKIIVKQMELYLPVYPANKDLFSATYSMSLGR